MQAPETMSSTSMPTLVPMAAAGGGGTAEEIQLLQKVSITQTSIQALETIPSPLTPMLPAMVVGGGGVVVEMPIPLVLTTTPPSTLGLVMTLLLSTPLLLELPLMPGLFAIAPLMWALAMTTSASMPPPSKPNGATTLPMAQKTAPLI